jgi:hypothetical protein
VAPNSIAANQSLSLPLSSSSCRQKGASFSIRVHQVHYFLKHVLLLLFIIREWVSAVAAPLSDILSCR